MKVNKSYLKNYRLAGSTFLILLGSLALSLPHTTEGHYIHPLDHAEAVNVLKATAESALMTGHGCGTRDAGAVPGLKRRCFRAVRAAGHFAGHLD